MAVKPFLDGSDIDIDKILAESEARLAARDASIQPSPKLQVSKIVTSGPAAEQRPTAENSKASHPSVPVLRVAKVEEKKQKGVKDDAGPEFFHMPRTNLTPQLKRDLQVLRMRNVLALGKQYFKKDTRKDPVPEFSQVGRIIEGNTDGSGGRLTRRERKRTIVEEVLGGDGLDKFKTKYSAIQERKTSGKKAHYKKLMARRRRG